MRASSSREMPANNCINTVVDSMLPRLPERTYGRAELLLRLKLCVSNRKFFMAIAISFRCLHQKENRILNRGCPEFCVNGGQALKVLS